MTTDDVFLEAGRSGGVGEFRKPAAYSVTEHSFPGIASTSSPVHHIDLREVPPKLPYQLCNRAAVTSSSPGGSLRSTGRVRFLQDGPTIGSGSDLTGAAYRMPAELCDPMTTEEVACMAGVSLAAPSSILRVRCLRGQTPCHFQSSADDLPPPSVTASVLSPDTYISKYNNN